MNARSNRFAAVLLLAMLVAPAAGCATKPAGTGKAGATAAVTTSAPSASATAASAAATGVVVSSGPITKPLIGSAVRTALMEAARKGLGTSSKFIVLQLYVQDGVAVGDVKPESGGARAFVAWTGGPIAWKMVWTAPFGAADAAADAVRIAVPAASPELVGKIVWKLPLPAGDAAMLSSFKKYAQTSVKSVAGAYSGGFTYTCKIARTPGGAWYGNCLAQPNQPGLESIGIYGKYSGGKRGGRVAEFGVNDEDALFFPSSVLSQLQL